MIRGKKEINFKDYNYIIIYNYIIRIYTERILCFNKYYETILLVKVMK